MKLSEFIKSKEEELIYTDKYRSVELSSAEEVGLFKNCVAKDFFSKQGDLDRDVKEVRLSEIIEDSSIARTNDNGVCVQCSVVLKGKRKPIKKEFYAMYV